MSARNLLVYCDESTERGRYFSNFYGGALIDASQREAIEGRLIGVKDANNLFKEIKWTKITENYVAKYISFVDAFFDEIEAGNIKIRIMFTQNLFKAIGLEDYQIDNQYYLLYYQFIKHSFGLQYSNPGLLTKINVHVYMDDLPDKENLEQFKDYMSSLSRFPIFRRNNVRIERQNITEVRSHDHVVLQGLDIILGAMQFRLNLMHKAKPEGSRKRGKRTIAKESVYKHIHSRICRMYPRFNIGVSTAQKDGPQTKWLHPYRHWRFIPSEYDVDDAFRKNK
jgi:hypothetical protein